MSGIKRQCQTEGCKFVACFVKEGLCYRCKHGRAPTGAIPHKPKKGQSK